MSVRQAAVLSGVLHIAVITVAVVGIPWQDPFPDVSPPPMEVELVEVGEETVQAPKPKPEPKRPEPKPEPKAEAPKPDTNPPPLPETKMAALPPPPMPEPALVELPPLPPKPKPKVEKPVEKPKPVPVPRYKPKPKPKPKQAKKPEPKKPAFDSKRIAALLDKRKRDPEEAPPQPKNEEKTFDKIAAAIAKSEPATPAPTAPRAVPLTISEVDLIRLQIERCWSVPAGARDAEDLVIRIRIYLNPDGSLSREPDIVDRARMARPGEEFFRSAAESAYRAVKKCAPLRNLPIAKYEHWRDIELTFNPKEMLGG